MDRHEPALLSVFLPGRGFSGERVGRIVEGENAVHDSRVVAFSFHERFQSTVACTKFLVSMLASRRLAEDSSCL